MSSQTPVTPYPLHPSHPESPWRWTTALNLRHTQHIMKNKNIFGTKLSIFESLHKLKKKKYYLILLSLNVILNNMKWLFYKHLSSKNVSLPKIRSFFPMKELIHALAVMSKTFSSGPRIMFGLLMQQKQRHDTELRQRDTRPLPTGEQPPCCLPRHNVQFSELQVTELHCREGGYSLSKLVLDCRTAQFQPCWSVYH